MEDQEIEFKVSSGLKDIIGRDLISDDFIAVFELVKNSFDAHATTVKLIFKKDSLTIWDNGKGMTYDEIEEKWLFVGYSAKRTGEEDEELKEKEYVDYRSKILITKSFAGAKGIGRFSCDRLGKELLLTTKKVENSKIEQLVFDWTKFEKNYKNSFTDIKMIRKGNISVVNYPKFKFGTILEISSLRSTWSSDKIIELRHSLEKLINPFEVIDQERNINSIPAFSIEIVAEEYLKHDEAEKDKRWRVNGPVKNFVFETLGLKTTQIFTDISEDGKFVTTELVDRGKLIYKIKEKNSYSLLSDIRYHLFYLNRSAKINFKKQMKVDSVSYGSVLLYKNGFRVYPFGEQGEDTLKIDRRKVQGYSRFLGTRELIGRISLFGNNQDFNEEFKETSSRDGGLKRTNGYVQMQEAFFDYCLKRIERYVVDIQWAMKDNLEELSISNSPTVVKANILKIIAKLSENDDVEVIEFNNDLLDIINEKLEDETVDTGAFDNLEELATKSNDRELHEKVVNSKSDYVKIIKEKEEFKKKSREEEIARIKLQEELDREREKTTYLKASSKSLSDDAKGLIHNIKLTSKEIINNVDTLIEKIQENSLSQKEQLRRLGVIKYNSEKVLKISQLITRSNFKTQANNQIVDIVKFTEQYFSLYSDIYDSESLSFSIETQESALVRKVSILDLSLVYDDLISNATKAGATKIAISCNNPTQNKLDVLFSDNGKGLDKTFWANPDRIFELGITTTDGSGIGLDSVRKHLKQMKATILFEGNGILLRGACFKIEFQ